MKLIISIYIINLNDFSQSLKVSLVNYNFLYDKFL